jgi:hypothetical protein
MTMPVMKILFATLALLTLSGCPNTAYFEPTPIAQPGEAIYEIRHTSIASDE